MSRLQLLALTAGTLAALGCAEGSTFAATDVGQAWRRLAKVAAKETVQVETQGQAGSATYFIASPGAPVEAAVKGPGRLRLLLRPEFPRAASAAEEARVTVSISGSHAREVSVFSMPSRVAHYAGRTSAAVPGEVVAAYLDLPEGKHTIRITAPRRVAVKLYGAR